MNFVPKKGHFDTSKQLVDAITNMVGKQSTLLIGIDGCGGSGKSTLANKLHEQCRNVTIVHMDDFYLPTSQIIDAHPIQKSVGADFDWECVLTQVLQPISEEKEGRYQCYDWDTDRLAEWHTVPIGGIVIVEGVYSIRNELADKYDLTIKTKFIKHKIYNGYSQVVTLQPVHIHISMKAI